MHKVSRIGAVVLTVPIAGFIALTGANSAFAINCPAGYVPATAPNGAELCAVSSTGGVGGGGGSVSTGPGGSNAPGQAAPVAPPAAPGPAPAPPPMYNAPAPAPVYNAPAPAPAPVNNAPAPNYAPVPASNVPAVAPSGQAPVRNPSGEWVDPASGVAVDAATAAAATDSVTAPDDAKIAADKAAEDKAVADKAVADKAVSDKAAADKAAADKVVADKVVADKTESDQPVQATQSDIARSSQTSPSALPILLLGGGLALAYALTYGTRHYRLRKAVSAAVPEEGN